MEIQRPTVFHRCNEILSMDVEDDICWFIALTGRCNQVTLPVRVRSLQKLFNLIWVQWESTFSNVNTTVKSVVSLYLKSDPRTSTMTSYSHHMVGCCSWVTLPARVRTPQQIVNLSSDVLDGVQCFENEWWKPMIKSYQQNPWRTVHSFSKRLFVMCDVFTPARNGNTMANSVALSHQKSSS